MAPKYDIEIYKDKAGEWRWRSVAENGEIVATSGEGYKNKADCEQMVHHLFECRESAFRIKE